MLQPRGRGGRTGGRQRGTVAMGQTVEVGVLGASGYTGAELLRLLHGHGQTRIRFLTAERQAGRPLAEVFPQFHARADLPDLVKIDAIDPSAVDVIFCCLPHGTTQEVIAGLPQTVKVIDLSADFRLTDPADYATWYGHEHRAPQLQQSAVYGLSEIKRAAISGARLVANPGCHCTAAELPLIPLLRAGLIPRAGIVIDSKTGQSGAGRALKQEMLFAEVAEGLHAYGVAQHRHIPEIEQELTAAAGAPVRITFVPHLVPMNRGMLATCYVGLNADVRAEDLHDRLHETYAQEPFVHVLPYKTAPQTRFVRGSNHCMIGVFPDRVPGRAILLAALDNLVKGASGQAVQNMNLVFGFDERAGLDHLAVFP